MATRQSITPLFNIGSDGSVQIDPFTTRSTERHLPTRPDRDPPQADTDHPGIALVCGHLTSNVWSLELPATRKLLLLRIAESADKSGAGIRLTVARLAQVAGCSERMVRIHLSALKSEKIISIRGYKSGGRGRPVEYAIDLETVNQRSALRDPKDEIRFPKHGNSIQGLKTKKEKSPHTPLKEKNKNSTPLSSSRKIFPQEGTTNTGCRRGTGLPEDWVPSAELVSELNKKFPHVEAEDALEEFRDYWLAVPGAKGKKLDWGRTFRNRVRELARRTKHSKKPRTFL